MSVYLFQCEFPQINITNHWKCLLYIWCRMCYSNEQNSFSYFLCNFAHFLNVNVEHNDFKILTFSILIVLVPRKRMLLFCTCINCLGLHSTEMYYLYNDLRFGNVALFLKLCFIHNLKWSLWKELGATLSFFSRVAQKEMWHFNLLMLISTFSINIFFFKSLINVSS